MTETELDQMDEWERIQLDDQMYEAQEWLTEWVMQRAWGEQ